MKDYVLKPYELLICKVPNDHKYDPPAKRRPVIILDPAYDAEDFEDKDFSLKDVYPIFIHGTSQVEKYKDRDDFLSFSLGELKGTNLVKPTGFFVSDGRLKKNESKNWSAYDIIHNSDFQSLGVITDDMKKKIIDFVKERNIPVSLYESKQSTQEEDLYEEIYDFIEDLYDLRKESIAKDGEFGIGNLVFKEMRNLGYLDELKDLSKKLKSRQLSLEHLDEVLNKATPYMVRNDGKVLECGDVHPYIKYNYETNLYDGLDRLLGGSYNRQGMGFVKWFYENTKVEDTKKGIEVMSRSLANLNEKKNSFNLEIKEEAQELLDILNIGDGFKFDDMSQILDLFEQLNNATNQEFLRMRVSDRIYGGKSDDLYFRVSSAHFNWYPIMFEIVAKEASTNDVHVTVECDPQATGSRECFRIGRDYIFNMPADEFLNAPNNMKIEAFESKVPVVNDALRRLHEGKSFFEAFEGSHPRYANGFMKMALSDGLLKWDVENLLSEQMVVDNAKRFFYELSKHMDVKFGEEYVILATNVDEHNEKKRDDNKDAYDNAVSYVENNGLRVSGYYLGDANPDTYIIERPNETTSEELADALAQDSFITFSFAKDKTLKTTSHDKKDEKDDRYSEKYTTSNVIFDALAKSCNGYTLLPNGVAFSFGLYGNDEDERFKSLTEDKKESMLKPNTPYMLRDDGKLLECGFVHPYIEMFKEASYEKNLNELLNRHSGFLDWFRENTKREDTASLVSKFESLEDKTNEEAKSLFEELSRKTNEEFCRVRTSNIKYSYGGDNGEIYFRIPVDSKVNWFDSIWKTVAENAPSIDYVTVVKDGPIVGKKQEYCSVGNAKLSHMPIDDFLTIEGNPTLN